MNNDYEAPFSAEEIDEQIDFATQRLRSKPASAMPIPDLRLIEDMQRAYPADDEEMARALERVRQRLAQSAPEVGEGRPGQRRWRASQPDQGYALESMPPRMPPAGRQRKSFPARLVALAAAVLLVVVIGGLVAGIILVRQHSPVVSNQPTVKPGQTSMPGQTATPAPTPCATQPTATAEAWFPNPQPGTPGPDWIRGQITGMINNGPVTTLSDFHYPLGITAEQYDYSASPHYLAWSPDARYIAAGIPSYRTNNIYPYLIDTTTHATTPIPQPMGTNGQPLRSWITGRYFVWADSHTLLLFYGGNTQAQGSAGPTYSYDVNTKSLTQLPGVQNAAEGVVRCSTLFYLELTQATKEINQQNGYTYYEGTALLHRYDLNTHTDIGQPVNIGPTSAHVPGPPDTASVPSWDVSQDGKLLVYDQRDLWNGALVTQQYQLEHVDGSGGISIPTNQIPNWDKPPYSTYYLRLSPDGQFVAITAGQGNALIFSLNVYTGAYRAYGNRVASAAGGSDPQWFKDSSGFDVVNTQSTGQSFANPYVSRYLLSIPPSTDGYVPGNVIAPDAQALALLS